MAMLNNQMVYLSIIDLFIYSGVSPWGRKTDFQIG